MTADTEAAAQPALARLLRGTGHAANIFGLADQALISATSFVTLLALARALSSSAFGAFVLVYTALVFLTTLESALVTQPHNVLAAARSGISYMRFTTATIVVEVVFLAATIAVLVLVLGVASVTSFGTDLGATDLLLAALPATVGWQLQELARRVMYTEGRLGAALVNDIVAYGSQAVLILVLWSAGALTGPRALLVVAASSFVALLLGVVQVRHSFGRGFDRADVVHHWHFGKWLAAAAISFWLSLNLFFYVAAVVLGTTASGELRAGQLVLGPLNVLLLFLATVLPIRFSSTLALGGETALQARLRRAFFLTAPVVLAYCLIVVVFASPVLRLFFGGKYSGIESLVALWAVYYALSYLGQLAASVLNARRSTQPVFLANLLAAVAAFVLGWPLISAFGLNGAMAGMLVCIVVSDLALFYYARRKPLADAVSAT